jgi:pyruvate/oxaloacetate carboxyltransferase
MNKIIDVTELALRDAHQSLLATRMALEDMAPACADIDQAGYWSVECWGGATFDACIRFLKKARSIVTSAADAGLNKFYWCVLFPWFSGDKL